MIEPHAAVLDPRMTFDTFVVGPGNRLASAAARRAADSPATSYNPLFLYSASGLGKSHILNAMAHHSERLNPDSRVLYKTIEGYLNELAEALSEGAQDELRERYNGVDMLLLDDIQFLTGQPEAQELLLRTLDALNLSGSQIVLASDRPPAEIDGLDARLLSRFSGGLMVDIAPPELETRTAILRRRADDRSAELAPGVVEAIARLPFHNVRELMGGLNRVLAIQDLEGVPVDAGDVAGLLGMSEARHPVVPRVATVPAELLEESGADAEEPWRRSLREAAEGAEAEGFSAVRLRRLLDGQSAPTDPAAVVSNFHRLLDQLRKIKSELEVVGNPWPEAARGVLTDPERVEEARALLSSARERVREFAPFPRDVLLDELEGRYPALSLKAAREMIADKAPDYSPLYVWSPDGFGARGLLEAVGATYKASRPVARVALVSAREFADEFITALSDGVAGAWRERWWTVEILLVHQVQELTHTERAQDEFFHLFEAVKRRGARILIAADRPPSAIDNIDDRLRSRFEGGLVVEVDVEGVPPTPLEDLQPEQSSTDTTFAAGLLELDGRGPDTGGPSSAADVGGAPAADGDKADADAAFLAGLDGLDGGSADHALRLPDEPPDRGGGALTSLSIEPDNFPTLLTERRSWERSRGDEASPAPQEMTVSSAFSELDVVEPTTEAREHPSESAPSPHDASQQASAQARGPAPADTEEHASTELPVSELANVIDEILAPFAASRSAPEVEDSGGAASLTSRAAATGRPAAGTTRTPAEVHPGKSSLEEAGIWTTAEAARWMPSPENVVCDWPAIDDRLIVDED